MRAHKPTHSCHMRVLHTCTRTSQTDTHSTQVPIYTIHAHVTYATRWSAHTPHTSAHVLSYIHTTQTHSYIHARAHTGPPARQAGLSEPRTAGVGVMLGESRTAVPRSSSLPGQPAKGKLLAGVPRRWRVHSVSRADTHTFAHTPGRGTRTLSPWPLCVSSGRVKAGVIQCHSNQESP